MLLFSANTATQTMGPRPAAAATAATPAVRTVPQYKYAAGVRNPQQHLNTQPQVAMQQVCDLRNWSCFCWCFLQRNVVSGGTCGWVVFVILELKLRIMAAELELLGFKYISSSPGTGCDPMLLHIFQLLATLAWILFVLAPWWNGWY